MSDVTRARRRMTPYLVSLVQLAIMFAALGPALLQSPIVHASGTVAAIPDLGTTQTSSTSITLSWTVPAGATAYDIRYLTTGLVTDTTWPAATQVSSPPAPGTAGTTQTFLVTGLSASTRYWFAIKSSDGSSWSAISNSPANLISDINQVDVWMFNLGSYDARDRRLMRVIQPDFIERAAFEWIGTALQDRNYEGVKQSLQRLQLDGTSVGSGMDTQYWEPYVETIGPGVNVTNARGGQSSFSSDVYFLNRDTTDGQNQLIYKAKKQVDNGFNAIHLDEYDGANNTGVANVMNTVRNYAQSTYGRKVYISTNSATYGGQDFSMTDPCTSSCGSAVDFYIRNYPFRLQGVNPPYDGTSNAAFDGTFNLIPSLRTAAQNASPKPFFYFVDFATDTQYVAPHDIATWPNFIRIAQAQVLAAGSFPGQGRSFYNTLDGYDNGIFTIEANEAKFLRENHELWHNLTWITPTTLSTSVSNIRTSAFSQTGRTLLHLVNGNYNNSTQSMSYKTNFTTSISLASAPTNIWLTTPDKPWNSRKQTLSYTYSGGVATITVPELDFHDVIVIEQGSSYNPTYSPMQIVFPYPSPATLPVNNNYRFVAVQTEGQSQAFNWSVNGIAGGNSTVGTINSSGVYTAPASVPSGGTVTIQATSQEVGSVSGQVSLTIVNSRALSWNDTFSTDSVGQIPANWAVIDGKGDWQIDSDSGTKVLHNTNLADGAVQGGVAYYSPLIVSGDQSWTNYDYQFAVKPVKTPLVWYGTNGNKPDTYISVVFRYQNNKNYYEYRWCYDDKVRLFKTINGQTSEIGSAVSATFPGTSGYTTLEVQASGSTLAALAGGTQVRQDSDASLSSGAAGISTDQTENYFKNLQASTLTGGAYTLVDNLNDWSKTYSHTTNLTLDSSNSQNVNNDTSRAARTASSNEEIVWKQLNMASFQAMTYFWPNDPVSPFSLYTSADGSSWTSVSPTVSGSAGVYPLWGTYTYTLTGLSNVNYVRVRWNNLSGQSWNPQIGQVTIGYNAVTDDLNDWSKTQSHTANLVLDSSNSQYLNGDTSRASRGTSLTNEEIVWRQVGMTSFQITAYFWSGESVSPFSLYTSADGTNWTAVTPTVSGSPGTFPNWGSYTYTLTGLSNVNYVKVRWNNLSGQSWNPQVGQAIFS